MNNAENKNILHSCGAIFSPIDVRDYRLASVCADSDFPEEFKLKMGRVKNQGEVGSCVAHSIASTIEHFNILQNKDSKKMSTDYIYGNRTGMFYDGAGMYTKKAIANTCKYGDVYEKDCPGNTEIPDVLSKYESLKETLADQAFPHRFSYYYAVKSQKEIKTALMKHGPVIFAIPWYDDMEVINGMLTSEQKGDAGGHCMVIYGWNQYGWLIQNSWSSKWGDKGRAILPYDMKIREAYGIVDTITADSVELKRPFSGKLGTLFAKIINWVINLFKR